MTTASHFAAEVEAAGVEEAGPAKRIKVEGGWSGQPEAAPPSGAANCPVLHGSMLSITSWRSQCSLWRSKNGSVDVTSILQLCMLPYCILTAFCHLLFVCLCIPVSGDISYSAAVAAVQTRKNSAWRQGLSLHTPRPCWKSGVHVTVLDTTCRHIHQAGEQCCHARC